MFTIKLQCNSEEENMKHFLNIFKILHQACCLLLQQMFMLTLKANIYLLPQNPKLEKKIFKFSILFSRTCSWAFSESFYTSTRKFEALLKIQGNSSIYLVLCLSQYFLPFVFFCFSLGKQIFHRMKLVYSTVSVCSWICEWVREK